MAALLKAVTPLPWQGFARIDASFPYSAYPFGTMPFHPIRVCVSGFLRLEEQLLYLRGLFFFLIMGILTGQIKRSCW